VSKKKSTKKQKPSTEQLVSHADPADVSGRRTFRFLLTKEASGYDSYIEESGTHVLYDHEVSHYVLMDVDEVKLCVPRESLSYFKVGPELTV
jgi:hypothetical protein